jgi:hypothetical protein
MMECDARWLMATMALVPVERISPLVNIGSSDEYFRTVTQPHVGAIFKMLEERGVRVIHTDLDAGKGIDVVGDLYDDAVITRLRAENPRALVCTHVFEHVEDREALRDGLMSILNSGDLFFITVPMSYHEHHAPIDTMYRPCPDELAWLFAEHRVLTKAEIPGGTYWSWIRKRPFTLITRHVVRFFIPFLGWRKWKRSMRKLYWLFHPYKVAAIAGEKI